MLTLQSSRYRYRSLSSKYVRCKCNQGHSETQNLGGGNLFLENQNFRSSFSSFLWKLIGCSLDQVEGYSTPVVKVIFRKLA